MRRAQHASTRIHFQGTHRYATFILGTAAVLEFFNVMVHTLVAAPITQARTACMVRVCMEFAYDGMRRVVCRHVYRHMCRRVCRRVCRHVCRHVYRHLYRQMCRNTRRVVCRLMYRHEYRHMCRHVCRHVYRHVYRHV